MPDQDYYSILGVARNVNDEEIRKAFRKKAMEFHPDRNKSPDAEEKFKEINEAYQVLSDTKKRAQYDRFGKAGVGANFGGDRPFDGFDVFGGFGDISIPSLGTLRAGPARPSGAETCNSAWCWRSKRPYSASRKKLKSTALKAVSAAQAPATSRARR